MSLLLKVKPLVISPELAQRIGLNEAIVLQQICYWLEDTTSGVEYDGKRWVYNSINAWNEQFPWWTGKTIQRTVSSLRKMGLIYVEQLKKKQHDQTNYYAINYTSLLLTDRDNLSLSRETNCPDRKGQSVPMDEVNLSLWIRSSCPNPSGQFVPLLQRIQQRLLQRLQQPLLVRLRGNPTMPLMQIRLLLACWSI